MTLSLRSIGAFALICVALSGCSGGADGGKRVPVYKVKGVVKYSGGPLVGATVAFAPKDGQRTAIGRTNDQGEYSLTTYDFGDGAAKGNYAVTVMKIAGAPVSASGSDEAAHGPNAPADSGHSAAAEDSASGEGNLIPANYGSSETTPLTFKVEEKENVFDFEIN